MKRGTIIFLGVLILIVIFLGAVKINKITGKATSQQASLNISVNWPAPSISIITPISNNTYLTGEALLLNFTSSYASTIWYNLDGGSNTTVTGSTLFNHTGGGGHAHVLYLYVNNSNSTASTNVTFYVNNSKLVIIDDEFEEEEDPDEDAGNMSRHPKKGASTDFLNYSYEELQNLSGVILHNPESGKIRFNSRINLTNDSDFTDRTLDLNNYVNISNNRIEINTSMLPNFNTTATLYLYGLTFTNPRILKDGSVCPDSICTKESYSGGNLTFNVTQFSVYTTEETPGAPTTGDATSGGSGGSGTIPVSAKFSVNVDRIIIKIHQGEIKKVELKIKNTGTRESNFTIENEKIEEFTKIEGNSFVLKAGEEKTIEVNFLAEEDTTPNLYIGKIIVKSGNVEKEILVSVEVESKKPLFDVKIDIPRRFRYLIPGENLLANVELYNLGGSGKVDVEVEYIIKDSEDNEILTEKETLAVETRASLVKELEIPPYLEFGDYVLYVKAKYNGETASATSWFQIVDAKPLFYGYEKIIAYIAIAVVFLAFLITYLKMRNISKKTKKNYIDERTILKKGVKRK
jgi:hypothetical protein